MKNGGNYIDREGKDGTVRYLPRSGLLEQNNTDGSGGARASIQSLLLVQIQLNINVQWYALPTVDLIVLGGCAAENAVLTASSP